MERNSKKNRSQSLLNRLSINNVVLIGSTGSGKTTVGYQLARILDFGVFDLDQVIEAKSGCSIAELFQNEGETRFRELESAIINEAESIRNHVVVCGGGAIENQENWQVLRSLGPVVWLATPIAEVVRRFASNLDQIRQRPLLAEAVEIDSPSERERFLTEKLEELLQRRMDRYQEADYSLTCSFATSETCAQFIKSILLKHDHEAQPGEYL